ncbi:MAG TPA: hypothetical protein VL527_05705 [Dongiaceae bacterium]|jgi:hypothetical protein|nr:hypothetical protein [Dongiaceae bacterium]
MNETNPPAAASSQFPPPPPPATPPPIPGQRPLGEDPAERVAISSAIGVIEAILRQPRRLVYQLRQPGSGRLVVFMLLGGILCSLVYGLVVGSFSGHEQWWQAPVKVSGGLLISALICLPSLYIFACLSGSQARLAEIFGLVAGLLLLLTLLLLGFAPVAWLFSQSTESLVFMGALHLAFWFVATMFGLRFLDAGFAHTQARSRAGLNTWVIIFMLVMVQMTTALRPIIGRADTFLPVKKQFFLNHWGECMDPPQKATPGNVP